MLLLSYLFNLLGGYRLIDVFLNSKSEIPIYSVETNEKKVALTFDIGWGDEHIPAILEILQK